MSIVSVREAAKALGVGERRVRQMLADRILAGDRVGRAWVIRRDDLDQVVHLRPEVGRPWNPKSAWAVLMLADREDAKLGEAGLSGAARSRAHQRLALGLERIVARLAARCERRRFYAHPGVMGSLDGEIVRSGVGGAAHYGAGLAGGEGVEGYVRAGEVRRLVGRFGLDGPADRTNVLLRVVADHVWPFEPDQVYAGRSVVAVDLLESLDPRARRAGASLLSLS